MFSPSRTALCLAIGAILAASEASAGCKIISGTKVCAAWITGSEICQVTADRNLIGPTTQGPNVTVECRVTGIGEASVPSGTQVCGPPPPPPTVSLSMASALAGPKKDEGKHKGDVCEGDGDEEDDGDEGGGTTCSVGVPVVPAGGSFTSGPVVMKCDKKGICKATAEVLPPDGSTCDNGGPLIDFTADQFEGTVTVCDGPEGVILQQTCTRNGHKYDCVDPIETDISCGPG